jgi:predicted nucleic acid-binding protein
VILVDTSVWIDHFRSGNDELSEILTAGLVLGHPCVTGELGCGRLRNREEILRLLGELPQGVVGEQGELLALIEEHGLHGSGLGWVDVHLLASARLSSSSLWTLDKTLKSAAGKLGLID